MSTWYVFVQFWDHNGVNGAHVRRIELGQKYLASPASPLTAVYWKWKERSALLQVISLSFSLIFLDFFGIPLLPRVSLLVSVGSEPNIVFLLVLRKSSILCWCLLRSFQIKMHCTLHYKSNASLCFSYKLVKYYSNPCRMARMGRLVPMFNFLRCWVQSQGPCLPRWSSIWGQPAVPWEFNGNRRMQDIWVPR